MPDILRFFVNFFSRNHRVISWNMEIPPGRYAIISGNHGFLDVYEEILKEVNRHNVLGVFHAGDICGPGPASIECMKKTVECNIMAIKGNHDRFFLGLDDIHKYKKEYALKIKELRRKAKKTESKNFKKYLQFPEKIRTNYFELVHDVCYPPYYGSKKRKRNDDFLYLNKIKRPVFVGSSHEFCISQKIGVNVQKKYLPFEQEILIKSSCVIALPSMNYSKQKNVYCHGYVIVDIVSENENVGGGMIIKAYDMKADFIKKSERSPLKHRRLDQITLTSKQYHFVR